MVPYICELRRKVGPMEKQYLGECKYERPAGKIMDAKTCELAQLNWNQRIINALADKKSRQELDEKIIADKEAEQEKAETARLSAEKQVKENKRNLQLQAQAEEPFRNAQAKYSATDAGQLVVSPKVRADGKNYVVKGFLEKSLNNSFIGSTMQLQAIPYIYFNTRFVVIVPKNLQSKYESIARVGGQIAIIGRYTNNREIELVSGTAVTVPVFEMLYLD